MNLKKGIGILVLTLLLFVSCYFSFLYYATYSEGVRSGELIKFSHKGILFKTWEGEISQGALGTQIFSFSVLDKDTKVISDLQEMEGKRIKASYIERYKTFPWWGDSKYYIVGVTKDK